ncbi:Putative type II secretion system protein D precursor [Symmachiella dynata]|uniref:secretin N-terminal domain-containing protein n=1 Tax=Symmachiella dynata TaxID=2527995 RepID=UPI001188BCB3|nr:secretin N-terminal domain-containing protein [Symmachiella dynata]QDT49708.1 Putative type II secretion system protein D precursor [Symmachiella dynata]
MTFSKLKLPLVCVITLATASWLLPSWAVLAAEKEGKRPRTRESALDVARSFQNETVTESEATVRLFFLNEKWEKVLRDVAKSMDKTLVADQVPRGFYSRRDGSMHSPETALNILNRALTKKHFRLVIKGEFLVLLDKNSIRKKYRPATVPEYDPDTAEEAVAPQKPTPIRRINHEEPVAQPLFDDYQPEAAAEPTDDEPQIESVAIQPGRRPAVGIARAIFKAFKPAARLVDAGPSGLPGFVVTHRVTQASRTGKPLKTTDLRLAVGIDATQNELVVEGPPEQVESMLDLVDQLDELRLRRNETVRLVAGTSDMGQVKRSLQPALKRLIAQVDQNPADDANNNQPPQDPQPGDVPEEGQPGLSDLVGGLKGDVAVESVPGMGILILRGNKADTEAVMRIIEEIQRLGQGAAPDIQVLTLRHVRSKALADLLTQLYEKLLSGRAETAQKLQPAIILPVVTPNSIVILAPAADMQSILKLANELDQPVAPGSQFQVFRLKSAVASQVVEIVNEFYAERGGLGPEIKITADPRTNAVFLFAGPRDMQEIGSLIVEIDKEDSDSINQMRLFRLENAVADELAETLNTAIQSALSPQTTTGGGQGGQFGGQAGGGEGTQEIRGIRSTILQFLKVEEGHEELIRSGILSDIRITADPRTNNLMVVAPEASMPLLAALIKRLDQPSPSVADIKMFKMINADSTAVVQILDTLFQVQEQGQDQQLGIQLAGAEGADSNLIPLQFTADARTNTIIARGGSEALRVAEAVILRLDADKIRERETSVYRLKNKRAEDVAEAINEFLAERQVVEEERTELGSLFAQIEREVIVVPEPISNTLIISATPRYFEDISSLVVQLDSQPEEVIIQALLVEVQLENTDEFGVELGLQDSLLFDRSIISPDDITTITETFANPGTGVTTETQRIISQASTPGFPFNNGNQLGNNTINPASVGTQGLSNFAVGRTNSELGFGGLVLSASSESISVLIRALSEVRNVEVLSRPQIRTLDNLTAEIQVGQDVPIIQGINQTALGAAYPIVQQDRAGIILSVKPRITPEGNVVMEVLAVKSAYDLTPGSGVPIFTDATNGNVVESPVKTITQASAVVSAKSGQTIVLGGMITKDTSHIERKVPFLGDLPLLGNAFRYEFDQNRRSELLIFLTPRIIHDDSTSEWIKQVEAERIHFFTEEAEAIHGPLYALPEENAICEPELGPTPDHQLPPAVLPPPEAIDEEGVPTTRMPSRSETMKYEDAYSEAPQMLQVDQEFSDDEMLEFAN